MSSSTHLRRGRFASAGLIGAPLLVYGLFGVLPIGIAFFYSLTDWDGLSRSFDLVGLNNYVTLLGDREHRSALVVTFAIAITATLALNATAIPLAVLLSRRDLITRVYRTAVFFPLVLSGIVVGFIWQAMFNTNGILNQVLNDAGFAAVNILGDPTMAVVSVGFVSIWQTLGFTTILYLAALRTIPGELYEAALLDGAGSVARFRYVTLPLLAPAVTVNVVLLTIIFMRIYETVLVMTRGGPAGSSQTIAYLLVASAFERAKYGYGSAMSISMLIVVGIISILLVITLRRREHVA